MRRILLAGLFLAITAALAPAQQPPPPVTTPDCTTLKGKAKKDCIAAAAAPTAKPAGAADPFAFPEEDSKKGGELQRGSGDMPTSGVPDPPSESLKPLPPAGTAPPSGSSSSSSSSSSDDAAPPPDDDAPPTTAGPDSPVNASSLKDLGSHGDSSQARQRLEQTRVEDDIRVGGFYYKDGNYAGATARFQDALAHDADNPDAHFGLAQVLLKQNKRAEAVVHLQRYLQLAPDDDHTKDARKMLAKLR